MEKVVAQKQSAPDSPTRGDQDCESSRAHGNPLNDAELASFANVLAVVGGLDS